jgi:sulfide:quinone oxidoreductase
VTAIDTAARRVTTSGGTFDYDYLVIALGADLDHDATAGYRGAGGHDFYSLAGADRLRPVIEAFSSGTLVLGVLGVPYKCPPAPYEVACQLHAMFVARGVRDRVKLAMVIPSPRPVPNPNVSSALEKLLADRGIELRAGKPIRSIDGAAKHLVIGDGTLAYDLFVGVPVHVAPAVVRSSGLVDKGFLAVSSTNLETSIANVYAIGDVAAIPAGDIAVPKAGAFAEDAARTVVSDILMKEGRIAERQKFLGLGTCYAEVGDGMIAKITANFFGGETPQMALEGPSNAYDADKREFASSRRARWFR